MPIFVICGLVGAGLAVAAVVSHVPPLLVMPFVLVAIAVAFSQVTLDVEPAGVTVALRGRFFKATVPYAEMANVRVVRYRAPNLGYRVGFGSRIWAVAWGPAIAFDRANGTRYIIGCAGANAALADIQSRIVPAPQHP